MDFRKATREKAKARLCFIGPSGSGKTYSALAIAKHLGKKIALIDTEHGSASKYSEFGFDVLELTNFSARNYIMAIKEAENAGYDILIIDSLSHAWVGKGGILEMVDNESTKAGGNKFAGWKKPTALHNELINTMIASKLHLLVTMRSKTEYVVEQVNGKNVPRKVGMGAIQRDGIEYEFDVVGEMTQDNTYIISKTRCPELNEMSFNKPGEEFAKTYKTWLNTGVKPKRKPLATPPAETEPEEAPAEKEPAKTKVDSAKETPVMKPGTTTRSVMGILERVTKTGNKYSLHLEGGGGPFSTYSKPAMQRACTFKRQEIKIHFTTEEKDGKPQFNCISFDLVKK